MKAGWGAADMTPPVGVELSGYGYYLQRRAEGVLDPLFVRAVALESDGMHYAIISCDVLGLNAAIVRTVLDYLRAEHGVPRGRAMIVSIHTHTGPSLKYHEGCGEVDPAYATGAAKPILRACDDAFANLQTVTGLYGGCALLHGQFAYNRANPGGPVDPYVRAFKLARGGSPAIAMVSYACHPVLRGRAGLISADYPGRVCGMLEEDEVLPIYLNGLCGDIDPIPCEEDGRREQVRAFARAIIQAYEAALRPLPIALWAERLPWTLRLQTVTREDIARIAHEAVTRAKEPGEPKVIRAWEGEMLERFDTLGPEEPIEAACFRLGGIPIVALPLEGFTLTGTLMRQALGDERALILGCAEELLGYLPTRDDIDRKAYAAYSSAFLYKRLPALPGEAERLGAELGGMLAARLDSLPDEANPQIARDEVNTSAHH